MVTILMISAKIATLDLLRINVFLGKSYDVIIYVYDITNEILLHDWNYIVDVIMWSNFGNFRIRMRKVIITSILQGFDLKNYFF